jgi:hypothetical protein
MIWGCFTWDHIKSAAYLDILGNHMHPSMDFSFLMELASFKMTMLAFTMIMLFNLGSVNMNDHFTT